MPADPPPSTPNSGSYEDNAFSTGNNANGRRSSGNSEQNYLNFAAKAIGGLPSPPVFPTHDFHQTGM